jgi:hypothetical protein
MSAFDENQIPLRGQTVYWFCDDSRDVVIYPITTNIRGLTHQTTDSSDTTTTFRKRNA